MEGGKVSGVNGENKVSRNKSIGLRSSLKTLTLIISYQGGWEPTGFAAPFLAVADLVVDFLVVDMVELLR